MPSSTTTARIIIANQWDDSIRMAVPGLSRRGLNRACRAGRKVGIGVGVCAPLVGTGLGTTPLASGMTMVGTRHRGRGRSLRQRGVDGRS